MPETILIVYAGIVLAQKGGDLPVKRHRYYLLDSEDRAIEDDDTCTFHFAKKLWGSHGIGSILTVQREEDSFSNSKFKLDQSNKIVCLLGLHRVELTKKNIAKYATLPRRVKKIHL